MDFYINLCFIVVSGYNPVFDETFEFHVNLPELALIRFVVLDDDFIGDGFIAQFTMPIECLQTGNKHLLFRLSLMIISLKNTSSYDLLLDFVSISFSVKYACSTLFFRQSQIKLFDLLWFIYFLVPLIIRICFCYIFHDGCPCHLSWMA